MQYLGKIALNGNHFKKVGDKLRYLMALRSSVMDEQELYPNILNYRKRRALIGLKIVLLETSLKRKV